MPVRDDQFLIDTILAIPVEDRRTEFKRLGHDFSVAKVIESIVAMANTDGGTIFLGIDDPEKSRARGLDSVYGIEENVEKFDEVGRNLQRIVPPISFLWPPAQLICANGAPSPKGNVSNVN